MFNLELRDRIIKLYERAGDLIYPGEAVNQWQHGWLCAQQAKAAGASHGLQAAAWLHDIGHLLAVDAINHEHIGADWLQAQCKIDDNDEAVLGPIRLHVQAKRYLVAREPAYFKNLSQDSVRTLALQGGQLTELQCDEFEKNPFFSDALTLRAWDEHAKELAAVTVDKSVAMQQLRRLLANV